VAHPIGIIELNILANFSEKDMKFFFIRNTKYRDLEE